MLLTSVFKYFAFNRGGMETLDALESAENHMPGETPTIKAPLCPLTEHQINTKIDEFIGSVDEKGIV